MQTPPFPNLTVIDHPLVHHKLTEMRDRAVDPERFRILLTEIATLMAYTATKDLAVGSVEVETPLERTMGQVLADRPPVLVPILRAGLGMVNGLSAVLPDAAIGHIGLYRHHDSLEPVDYYFKVPEDSSDRLFLVLDPMLATGGTGSQAITTLKRAGARAIRFLSLVAAPEGVQRLLDDHPDVTVITAALDRELDERGYIRPGLGDAGDRLFGTQPSS